MAMEKMNINPEVLERIGQYFDNLIECDENCPIKDKCYLLSAETCRDSMIQALTSDCEPKDYMVEVHVDGWLHIPATAISKEQAYEMAQHKAWEMLENYSSFTIDINPDTIKEL